MKIHGRAELKLHAFLTSNVLGGGGGVVVVVVVVVVAAAAATLALTHVYNWLVMCSMYGLYQRSNTDRLKTQHSPMVA